MEPGFRLSRAVGRAELDGTDTVVVIRDYTGRTPKEDAGPAGTAPTPLLDPGLEPEQGEGDQLLPRKLLPPSGRC